MVFRSYTYDASEVDLQYALDEDGKEIHEIVIDENVFTGQSTSCPLSDGSQLPCVKKSLSPLQGIVGAVHPVN